MYQPKGFVEESKKDYVCLLKRAIYGLHQSGREWYFALNNALETLNFKQLKWCNCAYVYDNALLLTTFFDFFDFGKCQNDVDNVINKLKAQFDQYLVKPKNY